MTLNYDYIASRKYCEQIGLIWLGDEFLVAPDAEAFSLEFTQAQVDAAMRHHLWQVKFICTPSNYKFMNRVVMALYWLTGWVPKRYLP